MRLAFFALLPFVLGSCGENMVQGSRDESCDTALNPSPSDESFSDCVERVFPKRSSSSKLKLYLEAEGFVPWEWSAEGETFSSTYVLIQDGKSLKRKNVIYRETAGLIDEICAHSWQGGIVPYSCSGN